MILSGGSAAASLVSIILLPSNSIFMASCHAALSFERSTSLRTGRAVLRQPGNHSACTRSYLFGFSPILQLPWPLGPPSSKLSSSGYSQTWSTRMLPQAARPRYRGSSFQALALTRVPPRTVASGRPQSLSSCAALHERTTGVSAQFPLSVPEVYAALRSPSALSSGTEEASTAPSRDESLE